MNELPRFGSPPRRLSIGASAQLLFGSAVAQIGWFLLALGSVFAWIFVPASDFSSMWRFRGPLVAADGKVTHCEKTSYTTGASRRRRGPPVYANYYTFEKGSGVSYATGTCADAGTMLTVEYVADNPAISRIVGMREKPLGGFVVVIGLIFPLIGGIIAGTAMRNGLQHAQVLCDGKPAAGKLIAKRATSTRINKRLVYEMEFQFVGEDSRFHNAKVRTHEPEKLEDEQRESMLYDPRHPSKAVVIDALPGRFATTGEGHVVSASIPRLTVAILLPLATIAINVIAAKIFLAG
jgi:hypothetical protein